MLEQVTATLVAPGVRRGPAGHRFALGHAARHDGDDGACVEFVVSPRRWGERSTGIGRGRGDDAAGAATAGGRNACPRPSVVALPEALAFTLRGDARTRSGLIGQNRSRRGGHGSEFFAIRPFQPGRPAAPGQLAHHAAHRRGARRRHQRAGGQLRADPARRRHRRRAPAAGSTARRARSTSRSAPRARWRPTTSGSATGSRCACSAAPARCSGPGSGRPAPATAAGAARPGAARVAGAARRSAAPAADRRRARVVVVLTPLLTPEITTVMVTPGPSRAGRRRASTPCVAETLPEPARDASVRGAAGLAPAPGGARDAASPRSTRRGIPVVPWRGPGTLDEVLRRLARRSRMPA